MGTSSVEARTERSLFTALVSAVFEWLLICMLFADSIFSFFITKCAHFWKLCTPCLLCSRLDHIFGSEKRGYIWNLICSKHKLELSSLVLCHAHNKLVNVHEMCENCLFSFATFNKSNSETYRLLVGKLGKDPYPRIDRDPLLGDQKYDTLSQKCCSCCKELYVPRGFAQSLIQTRSSGLEAEDLDVPLASSAVHYDGDSQECSSNPRPHVQYRELKITSDTESEGNGSILGVERANSLKDDLTIQDVNMEPNFISLASNLTSTKLIEPALAPEPLVLEPLATTPYVQNRELKITPDTESDGNGSTLRVETTNSKDDLTVLGVNTEPNIISLDSNLTSAKLVEPALAPEPLVLEPLVSLDDALPPAECGVLIGHGLDEVTPKLVEVNGFFSSPSDLLPIDNVVSSSNTKETPVEAVEESCVERSEEYEKESRGTEKAEILPTKATSEAGSEVQPVSSDSAQMVPNMLELGDAYKLAVGARGGRQLSGKLLEQWIGKESSKVSEDLKLLLTQLSFNRLNDQSREMSPRLSVNGDEVRNFDYLSAVGMQMLQKRCSLERNESGVESLDGSIISEIDGENMADRLKRQIEYDKKVMSSLYKELEEERNASAIAANQAMAMITRLQEEKANLHMEALHCLRMMEEQSEYDDDALQKANDLITEKDKEIQDLEAELEFYRINFPNAYTIDNLVETSVKERDIRVVHLESNQIEPIGNRNLVTGKPDLHEEVGSEGSTYNILLLEFEDEKLNIKQHLKKLENMLHLFSNDGVKMDLSNGKYFGNKRSFSSGTNDLDLDDRKLEDREHHACLPGEDAHIEDDHLPSLTNSSFDKESSELDCSDKNSPLATETADFSFLRNELSNLNKRMEALEADKNFLEHTINSLRKGEEGLQFVQEIASHLRELRKIETRS
ncbi:hypothetical protein IC582_011786 [Cucumis melo]|uniref:Myosin-binding protein 1-like n=1 Tax=Cucumis melo var. makuwa TaxID=1194695 RepID=A0A5D3BFT5_CUCMM|nr:myosin-binding protein 1-like [Cucumis melo var. makuwa]TYJ97909.1 myosin-binding protein 1-like [Cucumis melo var. makuwa]